jgi:hypothetical protein
VQSLADDAVSSDRLKGNAWVELVRAAGRFVRSIHVTEAGAPAAVLSLDGRCALCWQELDEAARNRLVRFQLHLEGAAQKAKKQPSTAMTNSSWVLRQRPQC